eukprot:365123-Chlamydomonas_euryale.AAC.14
MTAIGDTAILSPIQRVHHAIDAHRHEVSMELHCGGRQLSGGGSGMAHALPQPPPASSFYDRSPSPARRVTAPEVWAIAPVALPPRRARMEVSAALARCRVRLEHVRLADMTALLR